jgi:hypothetical protein
MSVTQTSPYNRLPEIVLIIIAFVLSGIVAFKVYDIGAVKTMVDQNSHLNLSRQVIDSMTPGISQIGFWPPLLHILMVPFVASDFLYQSGLAGFFTLVPFLAMAAVFLYKTLNLIIKNSLISFLGTLIFLMNPYVLYYTATPMMEILYMANLFACAYYVTRWLMHNQLRDILLASIFVAISTISRFEGLFLIPIVGMIIVVKLLANRKSYSQIESLILMFSLLAFSGFFLIAVYGYIFGNNPLAFMNSAWSAFNQQRDYFLPTEKNVYNSLKYFLHASFHLLSQPFVYISLIGFPLLMFFRSRFAIIAVSLILFSPFLFDFVALYRGNAIVYVPELPPYGTFFNERYGLYWAGFVFAVPVLLIGNTVLATFQRKYLKFLTIPLAAYLMTAMIFYSGYNLYTTAFAGNYAIIKQSAQGYPEKEQIELARSLEINYDYGKILMTRALHDFVAVEANIPLKNYIHESNYKYFDQTLHDPWLFARYVVMFNTDEERQDKWAAQNEKVSGKWGKSPKFHKYYTLVMENERERLYKVNDEAVRDYAKTLGYDVTKIPSINPDISWWNPDQIYIAFNNGR